MTTTPTSESDWRGVVRHVAFRALMRSVLVNMVAPAVLYRLATPHFASTSLIPLAISSLPPVLALAYSLLRLRAVDFLGLFAVENVLVNVSALLLAHTEKGALVGRSLQNIPLALLFLGSLAFRKPLVLYMARQFSTGNDPASAETFDIDAAKPQNLRVYRIMTWAWAAGLSIKAAGSIYLALMVVTKNFLILSPLWDLMSDMSLVTWSILYGRAHLSSAGASSPGVVHTLESGVEAWPTKNCTRP